MSAALVVVVPRNADAWLSRRLHRALGATLALLTLASFGVLVSRTLELDGGDWNTLLADMRLALAVTHYGHVWWWRVPALAIAWAAWALSVRSRGSRIIWIMLPAFALVALTRSSTGHPADHGDFTLAVWIDWLHLLAAGTWVGSLFGMSMAAFPALLRRARDDVAMAARIFQRLSTLCGVALAVLVACGVFSAVSQLGAIQALWTTRYGAILDVKLAIVAVMILIGAHNRYIKLPRLRAAATDMPSGSEGLPTLRACARAVLAECVLGLAVIAATATLLHAMPPVDAHSMSMAAVPPAAPIAGPMAPR